MYHVVFAHSETTPPVDGAHIASGRGYFDFGTFVEQHADAFPECAHLVEHGWIDEATPGSLARLDAELPKVAQAARATHPDVASVAQTLGAAVRSRPTGTVSVLVSDGEPGELEPAEGDVFG